MIKQNISRLALILLVLLIFITAVYTSAAGNTVPVTHLTDQSSAVPASAIAPPECDSVRYSLEAVVVCGGGVCNGSNANELIFGTTGNDTIDGKNGADCIIGGGGDDILSGDNGNDVLVGGPGTDTLDGGKHPKDTDICVDEPGSTTFIDCEVIQ